MVDAAFEAVGGFGRQAQTARGLADGAGTEHGAFQEDVGAGIVDLGGLATHDTGQGHGAFGVADAEVTGIEGAFLAVQGDDLLALGGGADDDAVAAQLVQVEGMQGLAAFEEDVVGHVHDVGDGTHAHGMQTVTDAHGRGSDLDAGDDAAGVKVAQLGIADFHAGQVAGRAVLAQGQFGDGQGQVEGQGGLAGQAQDGETVGAVGGDGDVQHLAVQLQGVHQTGAGHGAVGQDHDAAVVFGEAQLAFGADHAEGGSAAQLGLLDDQAAGHGGAHQGHGDFLAGGHVGGAADDVQQFALAGVHLADVQVVGFGMVDAFHHMAHHDGGDGVIGAHDFFQFQAQHGQPVAQLLCRAFIRDEFAQPRKRKQHMSSHWPRRAG